MLTLTAAALAAFPQWLPLSDEERQGLDLTEREHQALATLAANIRTKRNEPRADALLCHLCLTEGLTGAQVVAALPLKADDAQRAALAGEIDAWIEAHPWRIVTTRKEEPDMAKTGIERLAEVCERYPGILGHKIPGWVRDRLMDEAKISTATTFMPYVSELRGRAGIAPGELQPWQDPPGWNDAPAAGSAGDSTPAEAVADPEPSPPSQQAAGEPDRGQVSAPLDPSPEPGPVPVAFADPAPPAAVDIGTAAPAHAERNGHRALTEQDRRVAIRMAVSDAPTLAGYDLRERRELFLLAVEIIDTALGEPYPAGVRPRVTWER